MEISDAQLLAMVRNPDVPYSLFDELFGPGAGEEIEKFEEASDNKIREIRKRAKEERKAVSEARGERISNISGDKREEKKLVFDRTDARCAEVRRRASEEEAMIREAADRELDAIEKKYAVRIRPIQGEIESLRNPIDERADRECAETKEHFEKLTLKFIQERYLANLPKIPDELQES